MAWGREGRGLPTSCRAGAVGVGAPPAAGISSDLVQHEDR